MIVEKAHRDEAAHGVSHDIRTLMPEVIKQAHNIEGQLSLFIESTVMGL